MCDEIYYMSVNSVRRLTNTIVRLIVTDDGQNTSTECLTDAQFQGWCGFESSVSAQY